MQDRKYLLSISELLDKEVSEALLERCFRLLDAERRSRAEALSKGRRLAEYVGAGLLLQLAVLEAEEKDAKALQAIERINDAKAMQIIEHITDVKAVSEISRNTLTEILNRLETSGKGPLPLQYSYSEKSKPYLKNFPYYFSLSHSGGYVFCVLSEQEVGADLQWRKPQPDGRLLKRFFSEEEKTAWEQCEGSREKKLMLYRLWTRKEAYGKLTGEGIGPVIGQSMLPAGKCEAEEYESEEYESREYKFDEYEFEDYQIAICKWKQELSP